MYLHEEGVTLKTLQDDLTHMTSAFQHGRRLNLLIRNEKANPLYTTSFMCALFEQEGQDLFEVRQAILGHLQQGGDPSPFDRIQATRLAARCIDFLSEEAAKGTANSVLMGIVGGRIKLTDLSDLPALMDREFTRPKAPWWLDLRPVVQLLARKSTTV